MVGADVLYVVLWVVADLIAVMVIAFFGMGLRNMSKLSGPIGQALTGLAGLVSLGFGAVFCGLAERDSSFGAAYQASAIIGPIPTCQKIIYPFLGKNPNALCGLVDPVSDFTTGVLSFAEGSPGGRQELQFRLGETGFESTPPPAPRHLPFQRGW